MMDGPKWRRELWTALLVTVVTVLIWAWAAGELLEQQQYTIQVRFSAPEAAAWLIRPASAQVEVTVEGSKRALADMEQRLDAPITIRLGSDALPAETGTHTLTMLTTLTDHPDLDDVGVRIIECKPAMVPVVVDRLVRVQAEIRPLLPGVQRIGEITVEPTTADVHIPSSLRDQLPGTLHVNAEAEPWQIAALEPDVPQTLVVNVTPQGVLSGIPDVRISPKSATISFTIRSQIRELVLDGVRVQVSGTPENLDEYDVDVEPRQLRDLTIRADGELIRRIERESIPVVAFVHLTSLELEQQISSKPVSYYLALVPDGPGGAVRGVPVDAVSESGAERPVIQLTVTERPPQ